MWLKFKVITIKSYLKVRVTLRRVFTLNHLRVRQRMSAVEEAKRQGLEKVPLPLQSRVFLASSFKVTSSTRQNMLDVTMGQSLSKFNNSGIKIKVVDASVPEYQEANRQIFSRVPGLRLDYTAEKKSMPMAFAEILNQANEKYCMCVFDDMPMVNLSPDYLQAACQLLDDYTGVVDLICPWVGPSELNKDSKQVILRRRENIEEQLGKKLLGIVKYGDFSFAIVENFYYGFSLLNFLSPCRDYLNRLKWYMKHSSSVSAQLIEKTSMWFRGPGYNYMALPLELYMLDIDFERTESSLRVGYGPEQKELFLALKDGYNVVIK